MIVIARFQCIINCITTFQRKKQNWNSSGSRSASGGAYFLLGVEAPEAEAEALSVEVEAEVLKICLLDI
jgi:hypothetical protein